MTWCITWTNANPNPNLNRHPNPNPNPNPNRHPNPNPDPDQATLRKHADSAELPPMRVIVAAGDADVTIKVHT